MAHQAGFRFYHSLNDFLSPVKKDARLAHSFTGLPAVKDAIETLGVPHPEVDVILINQQPAHLQTPLLPRAEVDVYPVLPSHIWPAGYSLAANPYGPAQFVLDVHLGKLARALRMFGFDAYYENSLDDKTIAAITAAEDRIVLTRNVGLLKHKAIRRGYWLRSQQPPEQLTEVIIYFNLIGSFRPFTRCMACNGLIEPVLKKDIDAGLLPKTRLYFNQFFRCLVCQRIYWQGSHYDRMQQFVQQLSKQHQHK